MPQSAVKHAEGPPLPDCVSKAFVPSQAGGRTRGRVRINRSGNRQLNAALHRITITQVRLGGLGRAYYDKRLAAGDSTTEALRCLEAMTRPSRVQHLEEQPVNHRSRTRTYVRGSGFT